MKYFNYLPCITIILMIYSCNGIESKETIAEDLFLERYSESNNDNILSLEKNKDGLFSITLRRSINNYDDGFYYLKGSLFLKENRIVFNSYNQLSKENITFDFLPLSERDTLLLKNDNIETIEKTTAYSVLDTSFYSISYLDTIYKITIHNYRYLINKDVMVLFVGKRVGFVGRYVMLDNYILYIYGNIFHDIYSKEYKLYEYYPRIE